MDLRDAIQHKHIHVDDTAEYEPGEIVSLEDGDFMVMWILNDNKLSLIRHEPEVMH